MKLSDLAHGKDNNFNLLRILAALAVLVSHSFVLVTGTTDAEPFQDSLGTTLGSIAVDIFFVTSGFLVSASLLAGHSLTEFIWARILRIYPALWIMVLLTVFVLGSAFTTLPPLAYFSNNKIYYYLAKCMTAVSGPAWQLPGVFEENPYPAAVNGSLWSLKYEVWAYFTLAVVWATLKCTGRYRVKAFRCVVSGIALVSGSIVLLDPSLILGDAVLVRPLFMFFTGVSFQAMKAFIPLSSRIFTAAVMILILAQGVGQKAAFMPVYLLSLAYVLLFLAYVPKGWILRYNRLGDYSYGLYVYAFPVQQAVVAVMPNPTVLKLSAVSAAIALVLAMLSWHGLEQRALNLKEHCVGLTRRKVQRV